MGEAGERLRTVKAAIAAAVEDVETAKRGLRDAELVAMRARGALRAAELRVGELAAEMERAAEAADIELMVDHGQDLRDRQALLELAAGVARAGLRLPARTTAPAPAPTAGTELELPATPRLPTVELGEGLPLVVPDFDEPL